MSFLVTNSRGAAENIIRHMTEKTLWYITYGELLRKFLLLTRHDQGLGCNLKSRVKDFESRFARLQFGRKKSS